jgi:glycosyltransferase involved in cell wall biosynthesis
MKMKILVVQESDWVKRGPHQQHHLMERLAHQGHEIRVIDFDILWRENADPPLVSGRSEFTAMPKVIPDGKITVIRPPILQVPVLEYVSLVYTHRQEIRRQLDEFRPDIVIGLGILNAHLAISLCHKRGIPFVYYVIDELHKLVRQPYFQKLACSIEKWNCRTADFVLTINEGLREYTREMGAPEEKTQVIRAGIDMDWMSHADRKKKRNELGLEDSDVVLFFMGWLYEFSGLRELAQELASPDAPANVKLLVVGKGELWDYLNAMKEMQGMADKIITVSWQPYDTIPDFIAAGDICIVPAHDNGIMRNIVPIKIYEYMAAGKPVIATSLYGIVREFGVDHGVVYIKKPEEILTRVAELSEASVRSEHGAKSRKFVESNDWAMLVDGFKSVLANTINTWQYVPPRHSYVPEYLRGYQKQPRAAMVQESDSK